LIFLPQMIVGLLSVSKARLDMENESSALCHAAWKGDISQVYSYIYSCQKSCVTCTNSPFAFLCTHTHAFCDVAGKDGQVRSSLLMRILPT